jgi:hypothetical protein
MYSTSLAPAHTPVDEYASICADVEVLLAPDFEHCGCRKQATVQRMRASYRCFVPPIL